MIRDSESVTTLPEGRKPGSLKGRPAKIVPAAVLELRAAGLMPAAIGKQLGCHPDSVYRIIRAAGGVSTSPKEKTPPRPRPARNTKAKVGEAFRTKGYANMISARHRIKMRRLSQLHPVTNREMQALAKASQVPVTKCPPGFHAGYRVSWLARL